MTSNLVTSRSTIGRFRSVTVMFERDASGQLQPRPDALREWIGRYARWYETSVGALQGHGLHMLYDRDVMVMGDDVLAEHAAVEPALAAIRQFGFSIGLTMTAEEAFRHEDTLSALVSTSTLNSIVLIFQPDGVLPPADRALALLERVVAHGAQLSIVGPMDWLASIGALSSSTLNGADINWHPYGSPDAVAPRSSARPCFGRFRLFVDAAGALYPCLGLVGIPRASLGSIELPLGSIGLANESVMSALTEWSEFGPSLANPSSDEYISLPRACAAHRAAFDIG